MPSDESKGNQLDAIGSLAQRQLDNTVTSTIKGYRLPRRFPSSATRPPFAIGQTQATLELISKNSILCYKILVAQEQLLIHGP